MKKIWYILLIGILFGCENKENNILSSDDIGNTNIKTNSITILDSINFSYINSNEENFLALANLIFLKLI